jgi:hypothetical protein
MHLPFRFALRMELASVALTSCLGPQPAPSLAATKSLLVGNSAALPPHLDLLTLVPVRDYPYQLIDLRYRLSWRVRQGPSLRESRYYHQQRCLLR